MFDADAAASTARDGPGTGAAHRRRGRPPACPEPERRRTLLEAAAREFVEQGYAGASMDGVARRAGMSKRTLYQLFPTKDALFGAMAAHRIAAVLPVIDPGNTRGLPPRTVLARFLAAVARLVLNPDTVAIFRLVIAEAPRFPELARAFEGGGPERGIRALAGWLEAQREAGLLDVADAREAATMLVGMVVSAPQRHALLGISPLPSDAEIERRAAHAVDYFLDGCLRPIHPPAAVNEVGERTDGEHRGNDEGRGHRPA